MSYKYAVALMVARFDLSAMYRRARNSRRRQIVLRPIVPTASQAGDLYRAAFRPVVHGWERAIERLAATYEQALPLRDATNDLPPVTRDTVALADSIFDLESILNAIEGELQRIVLAITPALREWSLRTEGWHRGKWRAAVLTATGIDLGTMLSTSDVEDTVAAFIARNVGLVRSVSDEARGRMSDIVVRNYQQRVPVATVAREMREAVGLSRARSIRIAADQSSKLAARLDQARQEQAGVSSFKWRSSHKKHARKWHAERDNKIYSWKTRQQVGGPDQIEAGDGCGEPPFCGCRAQGIVSF